VLSALPSGLDVLLGFVVAAIEVSIAMILAHYLRPEGGWSPIGAKIAAAIAFTFAVLVIVAQLEWAPAHDTIPLRAKLADYEETLALDEQDHFPRGTITAFEQQISNYSDQLARVTERDQLLALMVTLGSDLSAWPALLALQYAVDARRRRRLHLAIVDTEQKIADREQQQLQLETESTLAVQIELERLGLPPDLIAGDRQLAERPEAAEQPEQLAQAEQVSGASPPLTPSDPVTANHLFGPPPEPINDLRWTDPI
jgi:hypothetical protein